MDTRALDKMKIILNKYISKFGCELIGIDTDFYCFPNTKEIAFALTYSNNADYQFNKLFKRLGLKYNCDPFILSFYHEIGHCVTWEYFNKLELFTIRKGKNIIENCDNVSNLRSFIYTNWLDEFKATQWACNYINKHPQEIKKMWETIQPLILQFYKDNGLT